MEDLENKNIKEIDEKIVNNEELTEKEKRDLIEDMFKVFKE